MAAPGRGAPPRGCDTGSPRGGAAGGGWKRHIIKKLNQRDRSDAMFQEVIVRYTSLLEKTAMANRFLPRCRFPVLDSVSALLLHNNELKKTTGELAYDVVQLQQQLKSRECVLEEQCSRMAAEQRRLMEVQAEQRRLLDRAAVVQEGNRALKGEYDSLLERHQLTEQSFREEKLQGCKLVEELIQRKEKAAVRMNSHNERRSRARQASLQRDLLSARPTSVNLDVSGSGSCDPPSSPPSRPSALESRSHNPTGGRHRSASATSPRILSSIKELFERRRRGHSVCSEDQDLCRPIRICVAARVPARALHVLEAHEQGINAVRFSRTSDLLATGGTDRVIKLWDVRAGLLLHRNTLDGSTEGLTSIDFDATGLRVLAASYDKSALLWQLDDSVPKLTLTGHSRTVTAARFRFSGQQVVTGSADRTLKLWDLHRAACVDTMPVVSHCSDLVCAENCIISGHFDSKIRVWDARVASCTLELPVQGKVTSLDLCWDLHQLLSCCRDDCLQLLDVRWSHARMCFRAEGFKCGSDRTKAVFSPEGGFAAAGSADGVVYIWNVSSGKLEARLTDRHSGSVSSLSWSSSGDNVVSVDRRGRAVLWSDI